MAPSSSRRAESPPRRLRACVPCTKAKAKCNFKSENQSRHLCDRCHHLGIECTAKTTKGIRKPRQLKPLASRVASLEQIIDNLTTRLASAEDSSHDYAPLNSAGPARHPSVNTPESVSGSSDGGNDGRITPSAASASIVSTTTTRPPSSKGSIASNPSSSLSAGNSVRAGGSNGNIGTSVMGSAICTSNDNTSPPFRLNWDQVNLAVMEFKARYTPAFPFVVVDEKPIEQLLADSPFLVRAIIFITVPFTPAMLKAIRKDLMTYLAMRSLVEASVSLDVLQGMLILIAWGPIRLAPTQIHQMMNLSVAHARSLGIVMPRVSQNNWHTTSKGPEDPRQASIAQNTTTLTMAQQRAYLGTFYLSEISSCRGGYQPLLNGSPLDVHAATRLLTSDTQSDFMVEKIVSIAEVTNKTTAIFGIPYARDRKPTYAAVVECRSQPLRAQLDKIAQGVAPDHPNFSHFRMHYTYALVRLYEPATFITDAVQRTTPSICHLQALGDCLVALKDFFAAFVSIEPHAATGGFQTYATLATLEQVSLAACVAVRILLLELEGWDLALARLQLDFSRIMESLLQLLRRADMARLQLEARFAGVRREDGSVPAEDFGSLERYVKNLHLLRVWYERRSAAPEVAAVPPVPQTQATQRQPRQQTYQNQQHQQQHHQMQHPTRAHVQASQQVQQAQAQAQAQAQVQQQQDQQQHSTSGNVLGGFELDLSGDWPVIMMGEWALDTSFL
ncbi:Zn(2)-Cys(6) zinc finger domain protein [Ceratocystis lukuohia]|uniref:Zn(2)-Cys(6) zinc finger domain protein n=1 Tax=Ceratocystis lukuohia TaxID=2019550 RepID=A0ABR4MGW9_9PEZI